MAELLIQLEIIQQAKHSLLVKQLIQFWYIENLLKKKRVKIYYDEPEHAFDYRLAAKFNVPLTEIYGLREDLKSFKRKKGEKLFQRSKTVENLYNNLDYINKNDKDYDVVLYVLDSLDTLRDAREIKHLEKKGIEKQDMGGSKARVLSQLFRNSIDKVHNSNICSIYPISNPNECWSGIRRSQYKGRWQSS